jgi:signal transduction histidine kinase/CheY-like chemotaxis protein
MVSALKWGMLGAAFGCCFPLGALWVRSIFEQGATPAGSADPLLWLIATAPFFLGLFGALGGHQHDQVRRLAQHLESLVRQRTDQLSNVASQVAEHALGRGELAVELSRTVLAFESAIGALDIAFAMYDADERLMICNRAFAELNEFPSDVASTRPRYEDLVRRRFADRPEFHANLPEGMTFDAWLSERLVEFRNPHASSVTCISGRWIRLDDKKTVDGGTVCTRTDVTSLKQAEFEARIQQQRLELAAVSAGIGIWETDLATGRVSWDARMEAIHGFAHGTFPGTIEAWKSTVHPEDLAIVEASIERTLQTGEDFQDGYRIVLPGGEVRHVDRRGGYTKDAHGKLVRRLGVNMDITEHVEKADALRKALGNAEAAGQAKAEFLATMSHEIRTPMNGVIGITELLLDTQLNPVQREHAELIRASGESLLAIINDILDFSKMEAGKLHLEALPFSVADVALESVGPFAHQARSKGVLLSCAVPDEPTAVVGDPGRVRQILVNLISNALKFTEQGEVKVRVSARTISSSLLGVDIEVSDTGIGMSPAYLERLGEAFSQADASTTRQYGGTGLGLSICRNLVQLMQGTLTVHSVPGEGSRFLVSLPLQIGDPTPSTRARVTACEVERRMRRVLVAEDNLVNQRIVIAMLKKHADHVELAVDGREAYEKFQQQDFDCVFMDGQMPGMDGLEATRLIRVYEAEHNKHRTPIIALTASAMTTDREIFLASGMDEYVTKPVRSRDLAAALSRLKDASSSRNDG